LVQYDWEWREGSHVLRGNPRAPTWLVDLIGVDYFGHVTDVRFFSLSKATDATFVHVRRLTQLERLHIFRSPLGDAGLAHLKGLTKLSYLRLHGARITDAGLVHPKGLNNLSELSLYGTQVTDAAVRSRRG
jgi:internalin A